MHVKQPSVVRTSGRNKSEQNGVLFLMFFTFWFWVVAGASSQGTGVGKDQDTTAGSSGPGGWCPKI